MKEIGEPFVGTFGEAGSGSVFEVETIDQGKVGDLTVQNGRQEGFGNTATVTGTVTRAYGSYVRFQDDTGPTGVSGLTVGPVSGDIQQDIADGNIEKGTRLYVRGTLSDTDELLRIDNTGLENYVILDQGILPAPQEVSLSTLQSGGEDYESELLRVDGLSFSNTSGTFNANTTYTVGDETASLNYRVESSNQTELMGEPIPIGTFTYEGVLGESGTEYQLVPIRPATALPVDLTRLTAVQSEEVVVLTWRTASETNNAGFRVQYEQNAGWQELGFVSSKVEDGTTGEAQSYRFTVDRRLGPGTHRFRLEQVDLDRTTALSDTVQVEVGMDGALHLSAPAPNPASTRATLSFAVQERTRAEVAMYNVLGQRVRTLYEGRPPGEEGRRLTVETETLSSGVYVVRLRAGGRTKTRRLTVVR
ncbi:T9SS type A sorting domain-containing protein [Salinibacter grassmerensis]|uniref:T9SS type A sorting domain-containing protein n=1 Tax=Salinibacter grassmerensis TaxID=3040353 RepID=UPI0021E8B991|nr:T9SS type A sorting domain-containing protein [Salinibacter grassmerensis]